VIGPRLHFATCAAAAIAITGWLVAQLTVRWARVACAALAAAALVYISAQLVAKYREYGPVGSERYELIWNSPEGAVVEVPRNPSPATSRLFLGDDFEQRMPALQIDYHFAKLSVR
jgi:hypothetical protein